MKSIFPNLVALGTIIVICFILEFVSALKTSSKSAAVNTQQEAEKQANAASDPTYPLPAMHILQIW